jgi:hypothetical protein
MTRAYDVRPNLEGYDALTLRSIAKFVLVVGLIVGAQYLADRYGAGRWLKAALELAWIGVGLKVVWIGIKAWKSGDYPPGAPEGPRYSDTTATIRFASPRIAAIGEIAAGLFIASEGIFRLVELWRGAGG